jgi:hypothetical protein
MQHEPCALLGDAQGAVNLVGADSIAAVGQHPDCGEPLVQANWAIFENCAELYRELAIALFTLPALLGLKVVVLLVAASRTFHTIWPTHLRNCLDAIVFAGVVPDGLLECLELFHAQNLSTLGLVTQVYYCHYDCFGVKGLGGIGYRKGLDIISSP